MTSAAYTAKRLNRLAAELRVELDRHPLKDHPSVILRESLEEARVILSNAAYQLGDRPDPTPAPADESPAVRHALFIASGRDGFAGPEIYATDSHGRAWSPDRANAYRFTHEERAATVANTRGGYALPV